MKIKFTLQLLVCVKTEVFVEVSVHYGLMGCDALCVCVCVCVCACVRARARAGVHVCVHTHSVVM
jgi:hypothetical protein